MGASCPSLTLAYLIFHSGESGRRTGQSGAKGSRYSGGTSQEKILEHESSLCISADCCSIAEVL